MTTININNQPPESLIVEAGVKTVQTAIDRIFTEIDSNPLALDRLWNERLKKNLLVVDLIAETESRGFLSSSLAKKVEIRGEESSLAPVANVSIAALLDMLDGSDLLERGLGNWCSALTLFDTRHPKIFTAVVGLSSKKIYYTQHSKKEWVYLRLPQAGNGEAITQKVRMAPREVSLRDASIAFYGQKLSSFLAVVDSKGLLGRFRRIAREATKKKDRADAPKFRLYNLAGNPMMISLIEGRMDAVVEVRGQQCHDVIPGFVIALRAGAVLQDLDGNEIREEDLARRILNPKDKFQYVLSCNKQLGSELVSVLRQKSTD